MALAIVPLDRNLSIPCSEQPTSSVTVFDTENIPVDITLPPDSVDDLEALMTELVETEGLSVVEACSQALTLTDELSAYAAVWDADAHLAGHPNRHAVMAANTSLDPVPLWSRQPLLME